MLSPECAIWMWPKSQNRSDFARPPLPAALEACLLAAFVVNPDHTPARTGWAHLDYLSDNGNRSRICFLPLIQFSGCFGFGFSVKFTLTAVHLTILRSVVFWGQQKLLGTSPADDPQPSCSPKTRLGGSRRTSPSCRNFCENRDRAFWWWPAGHPRINNQAEPLPKFHSVVNVRNQLCRIEGFHSRPLPAARGLSVTKH